MKCTYIGNFNEAHDNIKKRRMIGPDIVKALTAIVNNRMSCETFREMEAKRLMKLGKDIHIMKFRIPTRSNCMFKI